MVEMEEELNANNESQTIKEHNQSWIFLEEDL